jgi:hypothetical protein
MRGPSEVHARSIGLAAPGYRIDQLRAVLLLALRRKTVRLSMRAIDPRPDECCRFSAERRAHLLRQLGDGQSHSGGALIAGVVSLLGAGPLGHPETDLPGHESAMAMLPLSVPSPRRSAPTSRHERHSPNWPQKGADRRGKDGAPQ